MVRSLLHSETTRTGCIIRSSHSGNAVVIALDSPIITARLYVNGGDTPTLESRKFKTLAGAQRWAAKVLVSRESTACGLDLPVDRS